MRYSVKKMITQGYILPTTDSKGQRIIQQKFKEILNHTKILDGIETSKYENKALGSVISMIYAMNENEDLREIDVKTFYDNLLKFITKVWETDKSIDEKLLDRMISTFVRVMVS